VKIDAVKTVVFVGAYVNFYPIRAKISIRTLEAILLSNCDFHENRGRGDRTFHVSLNSITLICVSRNRVAF
jgi:hypothetical protein